MHSSVLHLKLLEIEGKECLATGSSIVMFLRGALPIEKFWLYGERYGGGEG